MGDVCRGTPWATSPTPEKEHSVFYEDFAMWVIFRAKRNKASAFRNIFRRKIFHKCVSIYFTFACANISLIPQE